MMDERIIAIIEVFEDFLEEKCINIPNDEKLEIDEPSNVYGTDWGYLYDEILKLI